LFPSDLALQAEEHVKQESDTRHTDNNQSNPFNHPFPPPEIRAIAYLSGVNRSIPDGY
jgi:hypothetical protein